MYGIRPAEEAPAIRLAPDRRARSREAHRENTVPCGTGLPEKPCGHHLPVRGSCLRAAATRSVYDDGRDERDGKDGRCPGGSVHEEWRDVASRVNRIGPGARPENARVPPAIDCVEASIGEPAGCSGRFPQLDGHGGVSAIDPNAAVPQGTVRRLAGLDTTERPRCVLSFG